MQCADARRERTLHRKTLALLARARADVFLEKPGAPTVGELEEMAAYAKSKGVGVFMGCE